MATVEAVLVGRGHERGVVGELLERARRGHSAALVVRGEAGIGKTALLEHAVERAEGMTVIRALGVESEAELQFSGLLELLRPLLDLLDQIPARAGGGAAKRSRALRAPRSTIASRSALRH